MTKKISHYIRWALLSTLCGILGGLATALFLFSLESVTEYRLNHSLIIWLLPLAGLFIGFLYHHLGQQVASGNKLILDEIHDPQKVVPLRMTPLILLSTLITHLFGGSAGREGTAVQMGASLSDQLTHILKVNSEDRKILLMAGMSAGFGSAIGAPFAGAIFGLEVLRTKAHRLSAWYKCLIASFVAYFVALTLRAPHSHYPSPQFVQVDLTSLFFVIIAGVAFGLAAYVFIKSTHFVEHLSRRFIAYPPLRPFVGGVIVVLLYYIEGSYQYAGLGIAYIQTALQNPVGLEMPLFKSLFTSLTVGTGFKGGEFIPLVYVGTTLGSALSHFLPLNPSVLASVGFAAVFGAASRTPLACAVMAMEIFGMEIGPLALVGCYVASYFVGGHSIYGAHKPRI